MNLLTLHKGSFCSPLSRTVDGFPQLNLNFHFAITDRNTSIEFILQRHGLMIIFLLATLRLMIEIERSFSFCCCQIIICKFCNSLLNVECYFNSVFRCATASIIRANTTRNRRAAYFGKFQWTHVWVPRSALFYIMIESIKFY